MLMGTLVVQFYRYQCNFPKDKPAVKVLVYTVVTLDIIQTVVTSHLTWFFAIANWHDPTVLFRTTWSANMLPLFAGLISGIVQIFYAWRIFKLSKARWMTCLAGLISLIATSQATAAIVASIMIQFNPTQERLLQLHPVFSYWLAGSFTVDILITAAMLQILFNARAISALSRTGNLVNTLISNAIQTGAITVVCAGVDLALFVAYTSSNFHFVPAYILGKLYSNSLLATLNTRETLRNAPTYNTSDSFGKDLQTRPENKTTTTSTMTQSKSTGHSWPIKKVKDDESDSTEAQVAGKSGFGVAL
ncbi:hypothetical protein D9613_011349 [Agrocybe pediades]|uniref:DUF6534 domain-containing protein n=1 Tax=Agrocybe pediades TaxID=84607 RepID=A0A8H4VMA8_9AGAR|nr:hypothetical protein D9613_011349 [Agrocybe pediades]